MTYRNIVVGTDGSPTAEHAVREAAELAKAFGARLTIVTAFTLRPPEEVAREQDQVPEELRWMLTDSAQAEERAGSGRTVAAGVGVADVDVRVGAGDPAEVLIDVAEDTEADLIVVGSKGMTSAARFVLGSVPNKVSHHAPCDLAIIHTSP